MTYYILHTRSGRIIAECPSFADAEDRLEAIDYAAPAIGQWFDIYILGSKGWELAEPLPSVVAAAAFRRQATIAA